MYSGRRNLCECQMKIRISLVLSSVIGMVIMSLSTHAAEETMVAVFSESMYDFIDDRLGDERAKVEAACLRAKLSAIDLLEAKLSFESGATNVAHYSAAKLEARNSRRNCQRLRRDYRHKWYDLADQYEDLEDDFLDEGKISIFHLAIDRVKRNIDWCYRFADNLYTCTSDGFDKAWQLTQEEQVEAASTRPGIEDDAPEAELSAQAAPHDEPPGRPGLVASLKFQRKNGPGSTMVDGRAVKIMWCDIAVTLKNTGPNPLRWTRGTVSRSDVGKTRTDEVKYPTRELKSGKTSVVYTSSRGEAPDYNGTWVFFGEAEDIVTRQRVSWSISGSCP